MLQSPISRQKASRQKAKAYPLGHAQDGKRQPEEKHLSVAIICPVEPDNFLPNRSGITPDRLAVTLRLARIPLGLESGLMV